MDHHRVSFRAQSVKQEWATHEAVLLLEVLVVHAGGDNACRAAKEALAYARLLPDLGQDAVKLADRKSVV